MTIDTGYPDSLYVDPQGRFAIGYYEDIDPMFVDAQKWEGVKRGMVLRVSSSLDAFYEKIAVLEAELDDVAIEHLKFFVTNVLQPELKSLGHEVRFASRKKLPAYADEIFGGEIIFNAPTPDRKSIMQFHIPMALYYEHVLACEVDVRTHLPSGFVASNADDEWMSRIMCDDPGKSLPYYRHREVKDSSFDITSISVKAEDLENRIRLYGLYNRESGITYLPPIVSGMTYMNNMHFCCNYKGNSYIINPLGGMFDVFLRHLPPKPVIDTTDYFKRLTQWVFTNIKYYRRESNVKIPAKAHYYSGEFIRAGFFMETTEIETAPSPGSSTVFLVFSAHGVPIYELEGLAEYNPDIAMWGVNMFHYNSVFLVMDKYRHKGLTQVSLLQVPLSAAYVFKGKEDVDILNKAARNYAPFNGKTFVKKAREIFRDSFNNEAHLIRFNESWASRTEELPGLNETFQRFDLNPVPAPNKEVEEFNNLIHKVMKGDNDIIPRHHFEQRKIEI